MNCPTSSTKKLSRNPDGCLSIHALTEVVADLTPILGPDCPVAVVFRDLGDLEIEHYLRAEQPYDCAGSAKSEGLGIALLERIDNDDPTALVGLPLIRTCHMIRAAGVKVL